MRVQSAKSKGRRLQQFVRDAFLKFASMLEPDDIRSTAMGQSGEDILMSPAARKVYPYSIECKNVEKLSIWRAIDQAEENAGDYTPMVVFKKNHREAYVAIPFNKFMELVHGQEDSN